MSYKPPQGVAEAARRGPELRREFGLGGTEVGVARARDLSNRRNVTLSTIRRMASFFARHGAQQSRDRDKGWGNPHDPSAAWIAWLLWGGDPGRTWVRSVLESEEARGLRQARPLAYSSAIGPGEERWLRILGCGEVFSADGSSRGTITEADLHEMARTFGVGGSVPIDWGHASSPSLFREPQPPETGGALGEVVAVRVYDAGDGRGPGLYAHVEHTRRGLQVVSDNRLPDAEDGTPRSALYSSPEFVVDFAVHDPATGEEVGTAALLALAYTTRPAQRTDLIDSVALASRPGSEDSAHGREEEHMADAMQPATEPVEEQVPKVEPGEVEAMAEGAEEEMSVAQRLDALEGRIAAIIEQVEAMAPPAEAMAEAEPEKADEPEEVDEDGEPVKALTARLDTMHARVQALTARAEEAEAKAYAAERDAAIDGLIRSGRIAPAERDAAVSAYDVEHQPQFGGAHRLFTAIYAARAEGYAVPMGRVSDAGAVATGGTVHERVLAYCQAEGLDPRTNYKAALDAVVAKEG